jgi:cytidylate kinase
LYDDTKRKGIFIVYFFRGRGQPKLSRTHHLAAKQTTRTTQVLEEPEWASKTLPSGIPPAGRVVVTISRQFGSGGAEIGRIIAQESKLTYIDSEIIVEVARRLGVDVQKATRQDEQTSGNIRHILAAVQASHPFSMHYGALQQHFSPIETSELAFLYLTQTVIRELATEGNVVIVGRGSQFLLHNAPRTLHIYVFAPLLNRVTNVMERYHLGQKEAMALVEQHDYEHKLYLEHFYGSDGSQPSLYHLLVNTSLFTPEVAAKFVCQSLPVIQNIQG